MTCLERIECFKAFMPLVLAVFALAAVFVIVVTGISDYKDDINALLGFAFVNLGVSR